jgi:hypothetical protein
VAITYQTVFSNVEGKLSWMWPLWHAVWNYHFSDRETVEKRPDVAVVVVCNLRNQDQKREIRHFEAIGKKKTQVIYRVEEQAFSCVESDMHVPPEHLLHLAFRTGMD